MKQVHFFFFCLHKVPLCVLDSFVGFVYFSSSNCAPSHMTSWTVCEQQLDRCHLGPRAKHSQEVCWSIRWSITASIPVTGRGCRHADRCCWSRCRNSECWSSSPPPSDASACSSGGEERNTWRLYLSKSVCVYVCVRVCLTSGSASLSLWVFCLVAPSLEVEPASKPTSSGRSFSRAGQSGCWEPDRHGKVSITQRAGSSHAALRPYSWSEMKRKDTR